MTYQILHDPVEILKTLCKKKRMWGMYLHLPNVWDEHEYRAIFGPKAKIATHARKMAIGIRNAAPYLAVQNYGLGMYEENIYLFFKTEKEMKRYYDMTVGDDGPTKLNPYKGKVRIYALTCSRRGQTLTENT
jgi:hypothetical protein